MGYYYDYEGRPHKFHDSDDYDSETCSECYEIRQRFDEAITHAENIAEMLYGEKTFNKEVFQSNLDDLCFALGAYSPQKEVIGYFVKKKKDKIHNFTQQLLTNV